MLFNFFALILLTDYKWFFTRGHKLIAKTFVGVVIKIFYFITYNTSYLTVQ
jgi:hypothetical protein